MKQNNKFDEQEVFPPYRGLNREVAAVYDDRVQRAIALLENSKKDITDTFRA